MTTLLIYIYMSCDGFWLLYFVCVCVLIYCVCICVSVCTPLSVEMCHDSQEFIM